MADNRTGTQLAYDTAAFTPSNYLTQNQGGWGGMATRMATGGMPSRSDVNLVKDTAKRGIRQGLFGQTDFRAQAAQANQEQANLDLQAALEARGAQGQLMGQLQRQIQGQGPTVAGIQAQQGIQQALRNASTQAANARGTSRALAQRSALYGGLQAQQEANRNAALMRAQEQISAMGQFGNLATQQRTGDIQTRGLSLDVAKADQAAEMQAQGINAGIAQQNAANAQKGTGALLSGVAGAAKGFTSDIRAKSDIAPTDASFASKLREELSRETPKQQPTDPTQLPRLMDSANAGEAAYQAAVQRQQANSGPLVSSGVNQGMGSGGIGGAIVGGVGSMGDALQSDERNKQDLAPLQPYSYTYKPGFAALLAEQAAASAPPGMRDEMRGMAYADARSPRDGIMAQDLERSPGGRKSVMNTPTGKAINIKRSLSFALANQAGLDKRLSRIEEALRGNS